MYSRLNTFKLYFYTKQATKIKTAKRADREYEFAAPCAGYGS